MRDYHCIKYSECLDEAARLNLNFNCLRCRKEGRDMSLEARNHRMRHRYPPRVTAWRKATATEIVAMINERKDTSTGIVNMIKEKFEV